MNEEQKFILEGERGFINKWIPSEWKLTTLPFKADYEWMDGWMDEWMNEEQELAIFLCKGLLQMNEKERDLATLPLIINEWMSE